MAKTPKGDDGSTRPSRVDNIERYWVEAPPEPSARCLWWCDRIRAGFRKNRRLGSMGYYAAAEWFGVYIWEYLHVLPKAYPARDMSHDETTVAPKEV